MSDSLITMKPGPDGASCEIHDLPDEGLGRRLYEMLLERYGQGSVNVCKPCVTRARDDAKRAAGL